MKPLSTALLCSFLVSACGGGAQFDEPAAANNETKMAVAHTVVVMDSPAPQK